MRLAGLDIGSRAIKLVILDEHGAIQDTASTATTFDPLRQAQTLLGGRRVDAIQATGYGRHLFEQASAAPVVSEILAHAAGAYAFAPNARLVLDIGGQDTKAIAISPHGKVLKFEMNDRCAAGTGKFLEIMAQAFGMPVAEFGAFADQSNSPARISSMCTVFAESEATGLMARGEPAANIALGLHLSMVRRSVAMLKRISGAVLPARSAQAALPATGNGNGSGPHPVVFTGGVARNPCMLRWIESELGMPVIVPPNPHLNGAYGAALLLLQKEPLHG